MCNDMPLTACGIESDQVQSQFGNFICKLLWRKPACWRIPSMDASDHARYAERSQFGFFHLEYAFLTSLFDEPRQKVVK